MTDLKEQLKTEIKLMARDCFLAEQTSQRYRDALNMLSRDVRIPVRVRDDIEGMIKNIDGFYAGGHDSIRGMKDASGNEIE